MGEKKFKKVREKIVSIRGFNNNYRIKDILVSRAFSKMDQPAEWSIFAFSASTSDKFSSNFASNLEKNKLLNDEMYSDSKARMFLRRGYSLNKINQSLRSKGIEDNYVKLSIEKIKDDQIEPDFVSALKLCKRRRIGPLRPESNRELFYKKDMGILARGGFSFVLSKRVLNLDAGEFKKLIKIIWFSFFFFLN